LLHGSLVSSDILAIIPGDVERKDVTAFCLNVLKILDAAAASDSKLTAIKVLDAWQGKGPPGNRVKVSRSLSYYALQNWLNFPALK